MTRPGRHVAASCGVLLAVGALAACGAARPDAATADAVTQEFYAAVAADQRAEACALLAPLTVEALEDESGTPCEDAILAGDVGEALLARADDAVDPSARVAGRQAQVTTASDVLFLTVSGGTWLITAAACDARPDRPYDCALEA